MDLEPKENSELLSKVHNVEVRIAEIPNPETNGNVRGNNDDEFARGPPDGGFRAYSVLVGSFLTNGLLFGVINSYSVIYTVMSKQLKEQNVPNFESKASLVGSLAMGTTFLLSPLSGVLTALMGLRRTAVLGGTIAASGLLLSSFTTNNVDILCFTYGVLYGLGASLAYTPSLAILGHYFKKYLGRVNGIVTIGSSIFTVMMPPLMKHLIEDYGLDWMFRVLAIFTFGIALCGLLFKPIPLLVIEKPLKEDNCTSLIKTIVSVEIWKNKKYRLWALSMPVALFGYFVPYVHIGKFVETFDRVYNNVPIQCIAATSGVGRLVFGFLADKPGIDRILLQQISFYVIGILTIILPFVNSFAFIIVISLGMGVFDGAFIALIGPIAFELVGGAHAAQAIGCMLGLAAAPLSIGPPFAAYLHGLYDSYTLPFVLAGISPLVGATLMFTIRLYRKPGIQKRQNQDKGGSINGRLSSNDIEKLSGSGPLQNGDNHHDRMVNTSL
ncbi:monocarboxylate transporter 10 [Cydia strobilella]|uniref:monocarboxylate transporter 10 n=1 Tax=Cydia strobilella TaxID=1100964 RepID=UPI003007A67B